MSTGSFGSLSQEEIEPKRDAVPEEGNESYKNEACSSQRTSLDVLEEPLPALSPLPDPNLSGEEEKAEEDLVRRYVETIIECVVAMQRSAAVSPRALRSSDTRTRRFLDGAEVLLHGRQRLRPPLSRNVAHRFETTTKLYDALCGLGVCVHAAYHAGGNEKVEHIVQQVAKVPNLVSSVLSIQEDNERSKVLGLPIMRRVLLCKYSVRPYDTPVPLDSSRVAACDINNTSEDSWLLDLLQSKDEAPAQKKLNHQKAVGYLKLISGLTVYDYVSVYESAEKIEWMKMEQMQPSDDLVKAFEKERKELFLAVAGLKLLIPNLFVLDNKDMEQAAITPVVQWALNDAIRQPFMVGLVFCDIFFHFALLTATRNLILLDIDNFFGTDDSRVNDWGYYIIISFGPASVLYFLFRLGGDVVSTAQISWSVFRRNLLYRWTIVEVAAVLMVVGSIVALLINDEQGQNSNKAYFSYQAFTLGLLWMKILAFLQVLNRKLAAYVLAVFKILHDIWLFLLILLVMVFAFGDMFYTIYSVFRYEGGDVCPNFGDEGTALGSIQDTLESPFCQSSRWVGYLGIYRVFIGDLSVHDFNANALTTVLFVVLTFFGIILLLNMLIALVLESYEMSLVRSDSLFGRARIALVAKGLLLEEILLPRTRGSRCRGCSVFMRLWAVSVVFVIVVYLIGVSIYTIVNPQGKTDDASFLAAVVCIITSFLMLYFLSLVLVHVFARRGWMKQRSWWARFFQCTFKYCVAMPVTFVTLTLLGARSDKPKEQSNDNNLFARTEAVYDAVKEARKVTATSIERLETQMRQCEIDRQNDFNDFCRILRERDAEHRSALKAMERRIVDSIQMPMKDI